MIQDTTALLRQHLRRPRALQQYRAGWQRQVEMAPFETPSELLRFVNKRIPALAPSRSRVLRAVVRELRRGETDLWATLLLVAFEPHLLSAADYLSNIWEIHVDEAVEAEIFTALLHAAQTLPLEQQGAYLALALQRQVRRKLRQKYARLVRLGNAEALARTSNRAGDPLERLPATPEEILLERESLCKLARSVASALRTASDSRVQTWADPILAALENATPDNDTRDNMTRPQIRGHILAFSVLYQDIPLKHLVKRACPDLSDPQLRREYQVIRGQRRRLLSLLRRGPETSPEADGTKALMKARHLP